MDSSSGSKYTLHDHGFDELLQVYENLGYHRDLVTHWAIPKQDAFKLLELIEIHKPKKILEVGTFVGFSTLLMAKYGHSGLHIHSVDPNFPLRVELGAMNTDTRDTNIEIRHQELALRAAQSSGLDSKITFHAGGYSTGNNYASTKSDPLNTVPVVGRKIGETCGPFDLIFIDGLHYEDAVLSDLRLAQEFLGPKGVIVLHDVIGGWGSNVRRAVFRFLIEKPEFLFQHGKYADLFDSVGVLQLEPNVKNHESSPTMVKCSENFFQQQEFVKNIVSILMRLCAPQSVMCFGSDRFGLLQCFADFGVTKLFHIGNQAIFDNHKSSDLIQFEEFDFDVVYEPVEAFDLCITVGDVDEMEAEKSQNFIESCIRASDTLFLAFTPPGESGAAEPGSKPMGWWVTKFWEKGFRFHDVIRPFIEPLRYSYSYSPLYKVESSKFSNIFLVKREGTESQNPWALLEKVLVEKEQRIEDLSLQAVYSDILLQDLLEKWRVAKERVVELEDCIKKDNGQILTLEERRKTSDEFQSRNNDLVAKLSKFENSQNTVFHRLFSALAWISQHPRILKFLQFISKK